VRGLSAAFAFAFQHLTLILIVGLILGHLLFAVEEHSLFFRLLTAIAPVLLVLETRDYLRDPAQKELPFLPMALLQYYLVFGVAIFWDLPFFDKNGPVNFSTYSRTAGGVAVGLGALCLWGGARAGFRLAPRLQPTVLRMLPPATVPKRWDDAFYIYGGLVAAFSVILVRFPAFIPAAMTLPVSVIFPLQLGLGFAIAVPPQKLGRRAADIFAWLGIAMGVLRGQLEPIFQMGMALVSGRWMTTKQISLRFAAVVFGLFVLIQPVKQSYRSQVWGHAARTGEELTVSERASVWETIFSDYLSDEPKPRSQEGDAAVARLSELGAVMHAFEVVPNRVDYLYGEGFAQLAYSFIPRIIWADKPTTREEITQRYAVIFGRQTEKGAETTAVGMCVIVEGFWNFGWPGIALVCFALGLVIGTTQRVCTRDHWALCAIGIAQISVLSVAGTVVAVYGGLFQLFVGRLIAVWGMYYLAQQLSGDSRARIGVTAPARVRANKA
jgi:hypothetical protein